MARIFTGDFSTGDASQYPSVLNSGPWFQSQYGTSGFSYQSVSPTVYRRGGKGTDRALQILSDGDAGYYSRMELQSSDVLPATDSRYPNAQETKLGANGVQFVPGQTRWFAWSTKFASDFPQTFSGRNGHHLICDEWHSRDDLAIAAIGKTIVGGAVFMWGFPGWYGTFGSAAAEYTGQYSLFVDNYDNDCNLVSRTVILNTPINRGNWIDIKMQVKFSRGSDGFINVWINNQRQTLLTGGQTWTGPTCAPGLPDTVSYWYVQCLYRGSASFGTQVKYDTNFRIADSEDSL